MDNVLECLPRGSRVAILRLRSLGDCVLTTPALDILKSFRPDLRVAIFVEDRFREIFEGNPDVVEILPPELGRLRRFRPQLCLNFHGGTRSAWMTGLSGARYRAGFRHYRQQFVYNVAIPRAQEILGVDRKVHTAEHLASATFFLGAPVSEIPRARLFPPQPAPPPLAPGTAIIHAVAASLEKTWGPAGFLAVAERLAATGPSPVFIGGPDDDLTHFRHYPTIQTSLSGVKSLLAGAALFVGNDSGPAHMAAAFGVPCVVVFGSSDPAIWGPWRTAGEAIASRNGIENVTAEEVLGAIERLGMAA